MPAPAHPSPHRPAEAGVDVRLPWWAVALPAVAFAALLLLMSSPGRAHAATDPAVGQLVERSLQLLSR
ncbi:hypothetical protein ACIP6P_05545 [Streptomyces sp. NPDC088729]|uniref:hypothetical protein n=1 Tax=Streptomyces sp. NPDC088729 TaxID=3365876 RepID=UPI00380C0926